MFDYVELNEDTKVAIDELGDSWKHFEQLLTPETATLFNATYNLITLAVKECSLSLDITDLFVDESLDTSSLVNSVRELFIKYVVDILGNMGIIIDKDKVSLSSLPILNSILNIVFILDDCEDVMGLIYVLENQELSPKEQLVTVIQKVYDLNDSEDYNDIIRDCSSDVIKGLLIGLGVLNIDDSDEYINPFIANRIKSNLSFLKGTLAEKHIKDGGGVGLSYDSLHKLYINDLAIVTTNDTKQYFKEIIGLLIISSLTNEEIEEGYESMIKDFSNNLDELYSGSKLLEEVKLQ